MEHVQVVILGGGPAGYTAALYCARAGFRTVILEKLSAGGQMATTAQIDNYPGFDEGVDGFELGMKMQAQAERFGAETYLEEVLSVDLTAVPKKIVTDSRELTADAVILATGASARKLGVPEEDSLVGRGVAYCATCDGMFYKGKTVAVIGGGNTAAADALFLSRICEKVILIHRRDTLRADRVYLNPLQSCDNLEFIWNSTVDAILHDQKLPVCGCAINSAVSCRKSRATASLSRSVSCPTPLCLKDSWIWIMDTSPRMKRREPRCRASSRSATCAPKRCGRSSPLPATARSPAILSRNTSLPCKLPFFFG